MSLSNPITNQPYLHVRGPGQWQYKSTDAVGTALGAGYFNDCANLFKPGDSLAVQTATNIGLGNETVTEFTTALITSTANGTVTVVEQTGGAQVTLQPRRV